MLPLKDGKGSLVEAIESTYSIKRISYVNVREHVGKYEASQRFFFNLMVQGLTCSSLYMGDY